ncbi:MAG: hypothetical protein J5528_01640 [Firmicutes bacterium]|nr:hypothetical protein [Bacillota bacterium]
MKDMIILLATIILGLFIFNLISGDENSIKSTLKKVWEEEPARRQYVIMVDER